MGTASLRRAWPAVDDPDRTARARIRDAAITRFAQDGIAATSLRSIAEDVGVSPPLRIGSAPRLPAEGFDVMPLAVLTAVAAALTVVGVVSFHRRDLQSTT